MNGQASSLIIEADHCIPARRKPGEASIHNGPAYHFRGLERLLDRHTTGREGRGPLIVYFRKKNIAGLVEKLRKKMDADLPRRQRGMIQDHALDWSFLSTHTHSCGDNIEVSHIGRNLHIEPTASSSLSRE